VFNLGVGEITVILLLGLIFFGPNTLSDLSAGFARVRGSNRRPVRERRPAPPEPLSRSEWFLVGAVAVLASLSLALAGARR
jgi:hypothetical protein